MTSSKKIEKFATYNPFSFDNMINYIKINKLNNKIISNKYKGNQNKYKMTCNDCEEIYETTWNDFCSKNRIRCKKCSGGYKREKKTLEEIKTEILNYGYKVMNENEYKNAKSKISIEDKEGYKYYISISNLREYKKTNCNIDTFSKYNKFTIENIHNYLKINGYNNKLISTKYINNDAPLIFTCENCGKEYKVTLKHLIHDNQTRCKKCSKSKSTYELKIEKLLQKYNYTYKIQYKINECKDKRSLPFDFAVFDNNNNLKVLIECDDEQHYTPINFFGRENKKSQESFIITQYHDKIKDEYCKTHNIKLIRIPYWDFKDNNKINNIIKNINL